MLTGPLVNAFLLLSTISSGILSGIIIGLFTHLFRAGGPGF